MDAFPSAGLGVPGSSRVALTLYTAVNKNDVEACLKEQALPLRLLGNRSYIGFRERKEDSMERASQVFLGSDVTKETHVLV